MAKKKKKAKKKASVKKASSKKKSPKKKVEAEKHSLVGQKLGKDVPHRAADIKIPSRKGQARGQVSVRAWVRDLIRKDPTVSNYALREKALRHWGVTRHLVWYFAALVRWAEMWFEENEPKVAKAMKARSKEFRTLRVYKGKKEAKKSPTKKKKTKTAVSKGKKSKSKSKKSTGAPAKKTLKKKKKRAKKAKKVA